MNGTDQESHILSSLDGKVKGIDWTLSTLEIDELVYTAICGILCWGVYIISMTTNSDINPITDALSLMCAIYLLGLFIAESKKHSELETLKHMAYALYEEE